MLIAQENFTTEALRMAIEDDPLPLVEALSSLDPLRASVMGLRQRGGLRATSQVALPRGWLDLSIDLLDHTGKVVGAIWIEVKIDAPESGEQLSYYRRQSKLQTSPVWLLTLASERLRPDVDNLSWNSLYRCARRGSRGGLSWTEHPAWHDFGTFLEEQRVASDALSPISDSEAGAAENAYQLIRKVTEVVRVVHGHLPLIFRPDVAEKLHWKNFGQLLNFIGLNFRNTGAMEGTGGPLGYGLVSQEGTAYWRVFVDAGRASFVTAQTIHHLRQAAQDGASVLAESGEEWQRPASGVLIVEVRRRATALPSQDDAVAWIEARLRELAATAILDSFYAAPPSATVSEQPDDAQE